MGDSSIVNGADVLGFVQPHGVKHGVVSRRIYASSLHALIVPPVAKSSPTVSLTGRLGYTIGDSDGVCERTSVEVADEVAVSVNVAVDDGEMTSLRMRTRWLYVSAI